MLNKFNFLLSFIFFSVSSNVIADDLIKENIGKLTTITSLNDVDNKIDNNKADNVQTTVPVISNINTIENKDNTKKIKDVVENNNVNTDMKKTNINSIIDVAINNKDEKEEKFIPSDIKNPEKKEQIKAKLSSYISNKYLIGKDIANSIIKTSFDLSNDNHSSALLLLSIIAVESKFDVKATNKNAKGLMQVMATVHKKRINQLPNKNIMDVSNNIQVGSEIFQNCLKRFKDTQLALQCYNGSVGDRNKNYSKKVLSVKNSLSTLK